jgi:gp16 family phage-associated protein
MTRKTALTPDQIRQRFYQRGETLSQWAAERGYDRQAVYRVMGGRDRGNFGRAHEIAVALGLKVPDAEPTTASEHRNTQERAVA